MDCNLSLLSLCYVMQSAQANILICLVEVITRRGERERERERANVLADFFRWHRHLSSCWVSHSVGNDAHIFIANLRVADISAGGGKLLLLFPWKVAKR